MLSVEIILALFSYLIKYLEAFSYIQLLSTLISMQKYLRRIIIIPSTKRSQTRYSLCQTWNTGMHIQIFLGINMVRLA